MVKKEKAETNIKKKTTKQKELKKKEPFFKTIKGELSKVKWPETKEVVKYSVATLFMALFIGLFFQLLEFISSLIKGVM